LERYINPWGVNIIYLFTGYQMNNSMFIFPRSSLQLFPAAKRREVVVVKG
jgi:hypothetical protein